MATKRAKKQTAQAVDKNGKDFLTEGEMKRLLDGEQYGRGCCEKAPPSLARDGGAGYLKSF
jgi:hypothetical protein